MQLSHKQILGLSGLRLGFTIPVVYVLCSVITLLFWTSQVPQYFVTLKPRAVRDSSTNHLIKEFQHDWLRHRRTLVDWERLISTCVGQLDWGSAKPGWGKENRTNAASSIISQWALRPAGEYSRLFIESRTANGRAKNIGGDSWRVYLRGSVSLEATVFDHGNGSYEAFFLLLEPGVYRVLIYLDYSLCGGYKNPPRNWFMTGEVHFGRLHGIFQALGIVSRTFFMPI